MKPGDEVICIDNSNREKTLTVGQIYTIVKEANSMYYLELGDGKMDDLPYAEHRFKKVPKKSDANQIIKGSDVIIIDSVKWYGIKTSSVGEVAMVFPYGKRGIKNACAKVVFKPFSCKINGLYNQKELSVYTNLEHLALVD